MPKHGKKYLEAGKKIESDKLYAPDEAVSLLRDVAFANFDETVEVHARLGIDPRQADQTVRSTVVLPHGTGQTVRVLVFAAGEAERVAREAGADYAGVDDLVQQIQGGWLEFDAAIAMADQMGKVGGLGRILGRRGLMPNPRSGTVVRDVDRSARRPRGAEGRSRRVPERPHRHRPLGHRTQELYRRPDSGQSLRLRRCAAASEADWRQRRLPAYTDCQEHDVPRHSSRCPGDGGSGR